MKPSAMILFYLCIISFFCSSQNVKELEIKLPMILDTKNIQGKHTIKEWAHKPYYVLTIQNIQKIKLDAVTLEGVFDVVFDYQPDNTKEIDDSRIQFYSIYIDIKKGNIEEYFNLINDAFFYSFYDAEDLENLPSILDTKNNVAYGFSPSQGRIYIMQIPKE